MGLHKIKDMYKYNLSLFLGNLYKLDCTKNLHQTNPFLSSNNYKKDSEYAVYKMGMHHLQQLESKHYLAYLLF